MRSVQPAQTNERAANVVVDCSSPCETHLCSVHNGNDFMRQFSKTYDRKHTFLANSYSLQLHFKKISKYITYEWSACFHGKFSLCCRSSKVFCERQFALQRQEPEKDQKNFDVSPPGKISADVHGCFNPFGKLSRMGKSG